MKFYTNYCDKVIIRSLMNDEKASIVNLLFFSDWLHIHELTVYLLPVEYVFILCLCHSKVFLHFLVANQALQPYEVI